MEMIITKKDIESIYDYMENQGLVMHMNNAGLSIGAMGFILTTLSNACDEALEKMEEENGTK